MKEERVLRLVPSLCGNHLQLSQREREQSRSMLFLQGPMLCVANCRNDGNEMMESGWVLVLYR